MSVLERLRPGRAPNGTGWWLVRAPQEWQRGDQKHVAFNAGLQGLHLAPSVDAALVQAWAPLAAVAAPDGTLYRADPSGHRLLAQARCDAGFAPVRGFGGRGFATGRLRSPQGVSVTREGKILVADTGNARVQVLQRKPRGGATVVAVLAGLRAPMHAAAGPCGTVYVADRGTGAIHVYSRDHAPLRVLPLRSIDPWTGQPWTGAPPPQPLAVHVLADGSIAVFDPARPYLWHMRPDGTPLPALPWPDAANLPPGWNPLPQRHAAQGEVVLGPIDSTVHNFAWHELEVDASLPPGTQLRLQAFAANEAQPRAKAWGPRDASTIQPWRSGAVRQTASSLVLANDEGWERLQADRLRRARPALHRFEGDGPVNSRVLSVPAEVARRLFVGDRITLTTDAGGRLDAAITGRGATRVEAAVSGAVGAFQSATAVRLIERAGQALPFGPLALDFLAQPAAMAASVPAARAGHAGPLDLPHPLEAFLEAGDVLEVESGQESARLELAAPATGSVVFTVDPRIDGDFSTATLSLESSKGRLLVEGALPAPGQLPEGSGVIVLDDVHSEEQQAVWIEGDAPAEGLSTVWLAAGALQSTAAGTLSEASWTHLQFPEARATDRGRYLWIRLLLQGAASRTPDQVGSPTLATATPIVHALRITGPRPSLLPWLPAVFARRDPQREGPGASFLERLLTLFEGRFTAMEAAYENVTRLLNPEAADAQWLQFVAAWIGLSFDPSWPAERRRRLVLEGAALQAGRGTPTALARYLEIYTGAPAAISEDFQRLPPEPIQLGARGALGMAPLGGSRQRALAHAASLAHRFRVAVTLPREVEPAAALSGVRRIVETMKPAHTSYRLSTTGVDAPRLGFDTVVGAILIPGDLECCDSAPAAACGAAGEDPLRLGGRLGRAPLHSPASQGARHA